MALEGRTLYPRTGTAITGYYIVGGFFDRAFSSYAESPGAHESLDGFLRSVGLERGTKAAKAVLKATFLWMALSIETSEATLDLDPETYRRIDFAHLRCKMPRMRRVYDTMRADLERRGYPLAKLDRYLEEQVRPALTVYSTSPVRTELNDIFDGFDTLPRQPDESSPCAVAPPAGELPPDPRPPAPILPNASELGHPPRPATGARTTVALEGRTLYPTTGAAITGYYVVGDFFDRALRSYAEFQAAHESFLRSVGLEPGTKAAEAVLKAAFLWKALEVETSEVTPDLDPETYRRIDFEHLRCKMPRMRWVYDTMRADLERRGYPLAKLDRYLEEQVRPALTVYSTSAMRIESDDIYDEFDTLPRQPEETSPCSVAPAPSPPR